MTRNLRLLTNKWLLWKNLGEKENFEGLCKIQKKNDYPIKFQHRISVWR
ncbi:hypothetical protein LEP1GSC087_2949 [Leptospira interrogans serovar Bataviae str. L1111]|nr:hypothetical protein LEP1GSC087_2949 [Leptospira interrogans serovar Bataviae str. L1111]